VYKVKIKRGPTPVKVRSCGEKRSQRENKRLREEDAFAIFSPRPI